MIEGLGLYSGDVHVALPVGQGGPGRDLTPSRTERGPVGIEARKSTGDVFAADIGPVEERAEPVACCESILGLLVNRLARGPEGTVA